MSRAIRDFAVIFRAKAVEFLLLVLLAVAAASLTKTFPADKDFGAASSGRQTFSETWWWAHQLYGCDPEQLSTSNRQDIDRWCRCMHLLSPCNPSDVQTLTDDECREVAETLSDVWPNLEEHASYFSIYQACLQRLAPSN